MNENSLLDILDPRVKHDSPEKEITAVAKLAKRCLNLNGKKRPTMKQVAAELELIRTSNEANYDVQEIREDEDSDVDNKTEPWGTVSYSSTPLNSVTLPLLVSNNTC
ncbi:putative kinase [Corchorus olitorius]|uniref:Kinase n=1 Tax=Corchorus olitorius TaxID=93759 RepID=A0A1R3KK54_9ROSI|nr:putative kinase [Corchorus olitorius]